MAFVDEAKERTYSQLLLLVRIHNPRDIFNRHLYTLEDSLEQYYGLQKQLESSHRLLINQLNQQLAEKGLETQQLVEEFQVLKAGQAQTEKKLYDKIKSYDNQSQKYKRKKEEFKALKYELQNETVPIEEFKRVQETN